EDSGAEITSPATSAPGTNGRSGFIWYSPRVCSTSGKATPAARTSISTWPSPATGVGTSPTVVASGPSRAATCAAFTRTRSARTGRGHGAGGDGVRTVESRDVDSFHTHTLRKRLGGVGVGLGGCGGRGWIPAEVFGSDRAGLPPVLECKFGLDRAVLALAERYQ